MIFGSSIENEATEKMTEIFLNGYFLKSLVLLINVIWYEMGYLKSIFIFDSKLHL